MLVIVEGSHQNGLEKTKAEYMLSYTHTLNRADSKHCRFIGAAKD